MAAFTHLAPFWRRRRVHLQHRQSNGGPRGAIRLLLILSPPASRSTDRSTHTHTHIISHSKETSAHAGLFPHKVAFVEIGPGKPSLATGTFSAKVLNLPHCYQEPLGPQRHGAPVTVTFTSGVLREISFSPRRPTVCFTGSIWSSCVAQSGSSIESSIVPVSLTNIYFYNFRMTKSITMTYCNWNNEWQEIHPWTSFVCAACSSEERKVLWY